MSALETIARKSFNGKFTEKIDFPIGHFMLILLMHYFDKYLDHMLMKFEQNRTVRSI